MASRASFQMAVSTFASRRALKSEAPWPLSASTCAMLDRSTEAKERRNNSPHPMPSRRIHPLNTINTGQLPRHDGRDSESYHVE
ncbi:hypothetical protein NEUTE1DRAFT_36072 [Neurospora tetrasperma FGSC 2508]|uniref:Uncharacterized protein n=1 Tax=Neurospora tetrasperma (strain FGSC 2508 / ATCC MYA-4615 / P0657) TaxID=510951 RepID=F8MBP2_NEUT8|nr:uncharacterized protein NEUTE1DRAFT_36072 [Neurospora tetrasperma FGSC 2508]EGO61154.1 hypothetical protein NEUTE1DRAFT_36072 [Neurospora tetrasperma FGSC 2508]